MRPLARAYPYGLTVAEKVGVQVFSVPQRRVPSAPGFGVMGRSGSSRLHLILGGAAVYRCGKSIVFEFGF